MGRALSAEADAPYGLRCDADAPGHCTTWSGLRAAQVDRSCLSRSRQHTGLPVPRSRYPLAVIELADRAISRLSFSNLTEAHVLDALRRQYQVELPEIRRLAPGPP